MPDYNYGIFKCIRFTVPKVSFDFHLHNSYLTYVHYGRIMRYQLANQSACYIGNEH